MAVEKNVLRYYIRSDGTFFPATENSGKIYPGSTYANLLDIYLEDGISENTFVQVNFLIDGKFVTEWLPTFNQGTETRVIENVSVPFTGFRLAIPPNVTQNASPTATKQIGISVRQVYGDAWQGVYTDYSTLNSEVPPTADLTDDYATAYVLTTKNEYADGFYQCQYDSVEEDDFWELVTIANTYQEIKTYGVGNATLQKGWVSPKGTVTISNITSDALYLELSNIEQRVITLETSVDQLDLDKLEADFGEYDPKTTFVAADSIAINDSEDTGNPKEMTLGDLMEAENVSFDNTATPDLEATTVQDVVEELETDIIAVDDKVDLHIADETNPHNTTASLTPFTPTTNISSKFVQEAIEEVRELLDDFPLDEIYDFGSQSTPIEFILYLLATDAPARAVFQGRWYDEHLFGTSQQYGGGVLHATVISPTEVNVYEYDATSGALGTITKTTSFATKIDKDISGYDSASLADANLVYIQDGSDYLKTTLSAMKTYMLAGILLGGTTVEKAEQDASGNVITSTYATKTENNTKVSKLLTGYSAASVADAQRMYIDDGGTPKYTTVGAIKTHIASDFVSFGYEIATADVDGLPDVAEPLSNKIYLVLISEPDEDNVYNEFLYVDGSWELFGTTEINLVAENVTYDGSNVGDELDDIKSALLSLLGE